MAISADDAADSARLAELLEIPFPLLSDPDLAVAMQYGVAMQGEEIAIPAVFVVGRDGTLRWQKIGDNQRDRPTIEEILAALDEARGARVR